MSVVQITSREFRAKQASMFELADNGEMVIIMRGKKRAYALVPVDYNELDITPELASKIKKARQEYREHETLHFATSEDAQKWMEEL